MLSNDFRESKDKAQLQCKTCKKHFRLKQTSLLSPKQSMTRPSC